MLRKLLSSRQRTFAPSGHELRPELYFTLHYCGLHSLLLHGTFAAQQRCRRTTLMQKCSSLQITLIDAVALHS